MTITLSNELVKKLEAIAAQENRPVEAVLQTMIAQYQPIMPPEQNTRREVMRAKLMAAGALVTKFDIPADAVALTVEERLKIGTLRNGAKSSLDLINEDRGDW